MSKRSAHTQLGIILAVLGVAAGAIALSRPNTATAEVVIPRDNTPPTVGRPSTPSETIHALVWRSAKKKFRASLRPVTPELERLRRAAMFGVDPLGMRALTLHTGYDTDRHEQRVQFVVRAPSRRQAAAIADFHARTFAAYWRDTSRAKYEYALAYLRQLRDERAAERNRFLEHLARCRRAGSPSEIADAEARATVASANLVQLTKRLDEATQSRPWENAAKQVVFASSSRVSTERVIP